MYLRITRNPPPKKKRKEKKKPKKKERFNYGQVPLMLKKNQKINVPQKSGWMMTCIPAPQ